MAETPDVVAGAPVDADWGNIIRDRTLQRYTSAAARSASVPSPVEGDFSYLLDTDKVEVYDGTAWVPVSDSTPYLPLAGGTLTGSLLLAIGQTATPLSIMEWFGGIAFRENVNNYITLGGTDASASLYIAEAGGGVTVNVPLTVPDGSSGAPGLAFAGGSGFFLNAQGRVAVPSSMSLIDNRLYMTSPDGVSNGYYFLANVSDGADFGFSIRAIDDTEIVQMRANGQYFIPGVYSNTTGNVANVEVASDGLLRRSTSARRYKTQIRKLVTKARQLFLEKSLPAPVEFKHKGDQKEFIGFIAEDVAEFDERLGVYNDDGEIENYDHRGLLAVAVARIIDLEQRLDALEG